MACILVVVAHPDDEILGCGGTLAKFSQAGDQIHLLILCDGVSSRLGVTEQDIINRKNQARDVCSLLQIHEPIFANFPDNRLDTVALLDIIQYIESVLEKIQPTVIFTHNQHDLNIDHELAHRAVMTACRPLKYSSVEKIVSFEVMSSSEWSLGERFKPNYYVGISKTLDKKLKAISLYEAELMNYPHPRSLQAIKNLSMTRGAECGLCMAEAFVIERIVEA